MEKPFPITLDGEEKQLTPDNCGVALFRDEPEKDYLDVWEYVEENTERHWFVFNNREFFIWLGAVAILPGDTELLEVNNQENGTFKTTYGWNPPVRVEDVAAPYETQLYEKQFMESLDKEWEGLGE